MTDDLRFTDVLPDPCGCETCLSGQQVLKASLVLGLQPLPLPFYQCEDSGGMLEKPLGTDLNNIGSTRDTESQSGLGGE